MEHSDLWLRDNNGKVVLMGGDKSFPQPTQGMLVPDYQQLEGQKFWASLCINMTLENPGIIDGCFADRAGQETFNGYNFTQQQTQNFAAGHTASLLEIQAALNASNNTVVITNIIYAPGIMAAQIERFTADESGIQELMSYAKKGILVQAHAGYTQNGNDNHCEDITNSLAAFLIGAEKYDFYTGVWSL